MSVPEPRVMVLCCPGLYWPGGATPPDPPARAWPGGTTPLSPPDLAGPQTARVFDQVLTAVTAFCPAVEAVEPGVCAFGARGPARYFGGETALAGRIIAAVADLGVESRVGVADGLFAAHLAARAAWEASTARPVLVIPPGRAPEFLARQPVNVLAGPEAAVGQGGPGLAGWGDTGRVGAGNLAGRDLAALLSRLGLRTLGDLAALPADDVASRFGAVGETVHRLARGLGSRPLAVRPPAEDLSVVQEFDPPEPLAEPVVFAAKALAERMHQGLADRGLTCVRVQVRAACADGRESRRLWRHDGLLSAAALADRVRWQLDGWRSADTDAADGGIAVLRLVPDQVVAGRHAGTGHARTRGRAAPRPGRRAGRGRAGERRSVRRKKGAPPGRGPAVARADHGCGAGCGVPLRP